MPQDNRLKLAPISVQRALGTRFDDASGMRLADCDSALLGSMLTRCACRDFAETPVQQDILDLLCAAAMSAPTKSDLQQRDLIALKNSEKRKTLAQLVTGQALVAEAPLILIFCGNNRRQRLLHYWQDVPFANDHLDAFFNATVDAAIALGAFVTEAEAMGLGCCPVSAVRNSARAVSDLIVLPDHVFPIAGLALGYPKQPPTISKLLPLGVTCHVDTYQETDLRGTVAEYDRARAAAQPYATQRSPDRFPTQDVYGWSDDKTRQYSTPERADFGAYVRAQGFKLD